MHTHGGLGIPTASQHNIFDSEKLRSFSYAPDSVWTSDPWILSLMLYQLSHPTTLWIRSSSLLSCKIWTLLNFVLMHFITHFGKFRPPYLGKATAARRTALPSPTSACWVFSCFRNATNSDVDYRVFNVRTWWFYACVYTQWLGTPKMSQYNIFDSEKLTNFLYAQFLLCSWRGSNLRSDLDSDALPIEPPRHPILNEQKCIFIIIYILWHIKASTQEIAFHSVRCTQCIFMLKLQNICTI